MQDFINAASPVIRTYSEKRFKSFFGCSIRTCITIFDSMTNPKFTRQHLLWALYFMKVYNVEMVSAEAWKVDTRKFAETSKQVLKHLFNCLPDVKF